MDFPMLILLAAGASILFSLGYRRYHETPWCKPVIVVLFLGMLAAILTATLLNRYGTQASTVPSLAPFASYIKAFSGVNKELIRSNFMNVVLFYPSGFFAVILFPEKRHPVLSVLLVCIVFAAISIGIEYCQYAYALGKAETDDVIHNTLGALIGSVSGYLLCRRSR